MATKMYIIDAQCNLHVGSGEVNYGLIDNLIQRDAITTLPNINSSSLKGALREFFKDDSFVTDVFGSASGETDTKKRKQGSARFFEANLLALPVRSDKRPYLMATSVDVVNRLIKDLTVFNCDNKDDILTALQGFADCLKTNDAIVFDSNLDNACIEDVDLNATYVNPSSDNVITQLFGENIVLLNSEKFKMLCDDNHLPVIARNNLENGTSTNLWYEQVLPRYSRLYFMLKDGEKLEEKMTKELVQIGANATIGYGFCKIQSLSNLLNK